MIMTIIALALVGMEVGATQAQNVTPAFSSTNSPTTSSFLSSLSNKSNSAHVAGNISKVGAAQSIDAQTLGGAITNVNAGAVSANSALTSTNNAFTVGQGITVGKTASTIGAAQTSVLNNTVGASITDVNNGSSTSDNKTIGTMNLTNAATTYGGSISTGDVATTATAALT